MVQQVSCESVAQVDSALSVHKTTVLRTPKLGSQKTVFMGLSESDFERVFLTAV